MFQEFRSELGELNDEDEDLETHYNLGIAYREMGLLDEAIGEFQKVAKAVQKGKPFRYSMNCATLLALSFMDKGEPKIASLWYQRALEVPGLDQEAVLALRYDLGNGARYGRRRQRGARQLPPGLRDEHRLPRRCRPHRHAPKALISVSDRESTEPAAMLRHRR